MIGVVLIFSSSVGRLPKIARSDQWEINLICSYQDHKPSMFECPFPLVDWSHSLARQSKPVGGYSAGAYTGEYV
jgi:hypothetical protein